MIDRKRAIEYAESLDFDYFDYLAIGNMITYLRTVPSPPSANIPTAEITLAEYNALKSENAELRRLPQSAYDGYMSIVSCKYAPCAECIHDSEPRCAEGQTWKWKHADEVLKLLGGG